MNGHPFGIQALTPLLRQERSPLRRVVLIDPYPITRQSLAGLIGAEPHLTVVGEATDLSDGISLIARANPDLALVDTAIEENNGMNVVQRLADAFPAVALLVHTAQPEHPYAEAAIRAGARGYVSKRSSWSALKGAIDRVLAGRIHLSEDAADSILRRLNDAPELPVKTDDMLSSRELELFKLLGEGYRPTEIAAAMRINIRTFESYSVRIRLKLDLTDSRELLRAAIAGGKMRHRLS